MRSFIVCPDCKRKLKAPETRTGKLFCCPGCQAIIPPLSETRSTPRDSANGSPQEEVLEEVGEAEEERPLRQNPVRKGKPIRKKAPIGLIVGLLVGGVVLLLLLLAGGGGLLWYVYRDKPAEEAQAQWQSFSPPNSDCTILLPNMPVAQTADMLGSRMTHYSIFHKGDELFYLSFCDLPAQVVRQGFLEEIAKTSCTGFMNFEGGGKVISDTPIALGNIPGREYQVQRTAFPGTMIERVYIAKIGDKHRLYMLMVRGATIQPSTGDAARFFDSFKITASATAPDFAAAAEGGMAWPPINLQPNPPQPNLGPMPPRPQP